MFDKIYTNADGKNVAKYVIYAEMDTSTAMLKDSAYAYSDKELTKKLTSDELRELYYKGVVICGVVESEGSKILDGSSYIPSVFYDGNYVGNEFSTLLCFCPNETSYSPIIIYSSEFTAGGPN